MNDCKPIRDMLEEFGGRPYRRPPAQEEVGSVREFWMEVEHLRYSTAKEVPADALVAVVVGCWKLCESIHQHTAPGGGRPPATLERFLDMLSYFPSPLPESRREAHAAMLRAIDRFGACRHQFNRCGFAAADLAAQVVACLKMS